MSIDEEALFNQLHTQFEKAYLDLFIYDLKTQRFNMTIKALYEVMNRLNFLIPSRTDLHSQLAESLNLPHVEDEIKNGVFSPEQFFHIITVLNDRLNMLQAPCDDNETRELMRYTKLLSENGCIYHEVVPNIIIGFHKRIDKVEADIKACKDDINSVVSRGRQQV